MQTILTVLVPWSHGGPLSPEPGPHGQRVSGDFGSGSQRKTDAKDTIVTARRGIINANGYIDSTLTMSFNRKEHGDPSEESQQARMPVVVHDRGSRSVPARAQPSRTASACRLAYLLVHKCTPSHHAVQSRTLGSVSRPT